MHMKVWILGIGIAFALTGCASVSSPSPTVAVTDVITANAETSFKGIAKASCEKAMADGVVETRDDFGLLIMVPKAQAYQGYSAAYRDNSAGTTDLIYEVDAFYSCAAARMWEDAASSGDGSVDGVTVAYEAGQYVLTEKLEDTTYTYKYTVENGLIASGSLTSTDDPDESLFTEKYGDVGAENMAIIKKAVDALNGTE